MAFLRTLKQGFNSSLALASLLTAFISNNSPAQNCMPPPSGLVAWWPGEGNAVDNVAGHNGSVSNGVTFVPGMVGQAFSFDGVHAIQVPNDPAFNFGPTSPMAVELWAYLTGSQPTAHFIGKRVGCDGDNFNYQMAYDAENGLQFSCSSLNGVYTGIPMPTNVWTHLAGTFDGTTFRFYINGSLVASNNGVLGPVNSEPLIIGGSGTCGIFEGLIDEPSIYNRALSDAEIKSIYDSGSAGKCPVVFSNQPPGIVAQPASQTIGVGSNVTFFRHSDRRCTASIPMAFQQYQYPRCAWQQLHALQRSTLRCWKLLGGHHQHRGQHHQFECSFDGHWEYECRSHHHLATNQPDCC
ncbi:LamG domain-containing protein [Pedosphaera parvula]|uniref:LamG domain-containing protein n=1 Tax=Pedosphaera parvula TaxID=1032527 RepID=UPI000590FC6B|nr:LamG domain-containing protein [Pedosphaera parvula]